MSKACRCFVADSLASIVVFAQDDMSRRILRTRTPQSEEDRSKQKLLRLNDSSSKLKMPNVDRQTGNSEEVFGKFTMADAVLQSLTRPPLFSNLDFDQEQARATVKPGAKCRVRRASPTFVFESTATQEWALTDGPVSPALEQAYVQRVQRSDGRFISFSGGCHLGLKTGRSYSAEVKYVDAVDGKVDVIYTDFQEWASGNSGHTGSRGSTGKNLPPLQESEVELERVKVLPTHDWYWEFQAVWDACGSFTCMGLDFEDDAPGGLSRVVQKKEGPEEVSCSFLELADLLRDTCHAHIYRCEYLSERARHIPEEAEGVELLASALREYRASPSQGKMWPPNSQMQLGKRLMLRLLRNEEAWKEWQEKGGESPFYVTTLFKRQRFVHLVES